MDPISDERLKALAESGECDCRVCYGDCQRGLAREFLALRARLAGGGEAVACPRCGNNRIAKDHDSLACGDCKMLWPLSFLYAPPAPAPVARPDLLRALWKAAEDMRTAIGLKRGPGWRALDAAIIGVVQTGGIDAVLGLTPPPAEGGR